MQEALTFFLVADHLFAAPTTQIRGFTRSLAELQASDALPLLDLHRWLGLPGAQGSKAILVEVEQSEVGLVVDAIVNLQTAPSPVLTLPSLVVAVGCDPAVSGVTLIDDRPTLVLDLEVLARRLNRQECFVGDGGS